MQSNQLNRLVVQKYYKIHYNFHHSKQSQIVTVLSCSQEIYLQTFWDDRVWWKEQSDELFVHLVLKTKAWPVCGELKSIGVSKPDQHPLLTPLQWPSTQQENDAVMVKNSLYSLRFQNTDQMDAREC